MYFVDNGMAFNIRGELVERDIINYPSTYDTFATYVDRYEKTDSAVYSDRLLDWDGIKFRKCVKEVWGDERQLFTSSQPKDIEKFLSKYFDKDVVLTGIEQGINRSNGIPFCIFYYRDNK